MADVENIVTGMAGRYAAALFSLAKDSRSIDVVAADLKSFDRMVQSSPDLQLMVRSPVFTAEDQSRALKAVLERAGIGGLTANFLLLVAGKRRLFAVRTMIRDFQLLDDADRGVSRARIIVAEPLDGRDLEALTQSLRDATGGKTVELDVKVDPEIIGGIIVHLGSRMVDASIRTKLNSIRTRMKEVG